MQKGCVYFSPSKFRKKHKNAKYDYFAENNKNQPWKQMMRKRKKKKMIYRRFSTRTRRYKPI